MIKTTNGDYSYALMPLSAKNWNGKDNELESRCLIARCENIKAPKVIGLAIGESPEGGFMFDIAYYDLSKIIDELVVEVNLTKEELGFFNKSKLLFTFRRCEIKFRMLNIFI